MARLQEDQKLIVSLENLLQKDKSVIEWFNATFSSQASIAWLQNSCNISINPHQGRGGRRELQITKKSHMKCTEVQKYTSNNTNKLLHLNKRTEELLSASSVLAPTPTALPTSPLVLDAPSPVEGEPPEPPRLHVVQGPAAGLGLEVELRDAGLPPVPQEPHPVAHTAPAPNASAPPPPRPKREKLLSRLSRAKISFHKVSKRQKQKVRKAVVAKLCKVIQEHVQVDGEHITYHDVLLDAAQAVDHRTRKRKRREERKESAKLPLIRKLAETYSAGDKTKVEKRRILSTFSREFTLKELNAFVFSSGSGVKVRSTRKLQ